MHDTFVKTRRRARLGRGQGAMDRSGLTRRAGALALALGITAAVGTFSPLIASGLAAVPGWFGYLLVLALALLGWGLPILISHSLWWAVRPGPGSRSFVVALSCYCAHLVVLGALILGSWTLPSRLNTPMVYAGLMTATSSVPGLVSLAGTLAVAVGLWRSSLSPRWVAWLGIISVAAFAVLAAPNAYQLHATLVDPQVAVSSLAVWVGSLAYLARAFGVVFWVALGFSLRRTTRSAGEGGDLLPGRAAGVVAGGHKVESRKEEHAPQLMRIT
jgi:hypothetical protein